MDCLEPGSEPEHYDDVERTPRQEDFWATFLTGYDPMPAIENSETTIDFTRKEASQPLVLSS